MVFWTAPIFLGTPANLVEGTASHDASMLKAPTKGVMVSETGPVPLTSTIRANNLSYGWCEVDTDLGIRRTSATLSGAAVTDWPATQGLAGCIELQIDIPSSWNGSEGRSVRNAQEHQRLTGTPAQLLSRLATYPIKRLRFTHGDLPVEIRPCHKRDLALLVIGDDEYLILTTPRLPGDRVYRRIARQLVQDTRVSGVATAKDQLH